MRLSLACPYGVGSLEIESEKGQATAPIPESLICVDVFPTSNPKRGVFHWKSGYLEDDYFTDLASYIFSGRDADACPVESPATVVDVSKLPDAGMSGYVVFAKEPLNFCMELEA